MVGSLQKTQVVWLPPFEVGTIIALGLNYADHAKELAFKAQEEPLVFLKGPARYRPRGSPAARPTSSSCTMNASSRSSSAERAPKRPSRSDALDHVAGYCIANDYAIRDYLENWYRPNLRVKNRDGCTPSAPGWSMPRTSPIPWQLALRTYVNGNLTQ